MKKFSSKSAATKDEMLPQFDFRGGVRGKYAARFAQGTNVVLLAPDVAKRFPTARSVNAALRSLIASRKSAQPVRRQRRKAG